MRRVYLDHSATTPLDPSVLEAMTPYMSFAFGNPNSLHLWGREAREAVERARSQVAALVGASPEEIVFTGGGSESDNLAIKGVAWRLKGRGRHLITSSVEHHAVLDAFRWLQGQGFEVTYLSVDRYGMVSSEELRRSIRDDTILVSVMFANNEVGTIQPIEELGAICRERGVLFHTDAIQAVGHLPVDVSKLPVDLMTISAHKMYGPKGVGALYVRRGVKLEPLVHGGGQERGLRSGTENVAGIVGFGAAASLALRRLESGDEERVKALRDRLVRGVLSSVPEVELTGHPTRRLPFHASFCVSHVEGEAMILRLDALGIGVSSGSACTSGSLEPSHVLLAMGIEHKTAHGSLRVTLGKDNVEEDVDYFVESLRRVVEELRSISPYGKGNR